LQDSNTSELVLNYSYDVTIALCKFIYGADTQIDPTIASELLNAASEFKLDKLSEVFFVPKNQGKKDVVHGESEDLLSDLKFALDDTKFADVTFLVENTKITGHKVILAARSGFMQGLLASGMKESRQEDAIELHDIQLPIFMILKEFIYAEITPSFETNVLDILQYSHLYGIHRLTELSEAHLATTLSNTNVFSTLQLCEFYDLEKLQKVVIHYLKENIDTITTQSEFQDLDKDMKKRLESLQQMKKEYSSNSTLSNAKSPYSVYELPIIE